MLARYESPPEPLQVVIATSYTATRELVPCNEIQGHFFVSYKRDDWNRIVLTIEQMQGMGFNVCWDQGIPGGAQWKELIRARIESSCAVILFLTGKAEASTWVKTELAIARQTLRRILPIVLDKPEPDSEFDLLLQDVQYVVDPGASPSRQLEMALRDLCLKASCK